MMEIRLTLIFFLVSQISCTILSNNNLPKTTEISDQTPSPTRTIVKTQIELNEIEKQGIYFGLLDHIVDERYIQGGMNSQLVYRKETITPLEIDRLENNSNISTSLIESLKTANQKTEMLLEHYGVPATIQAYSGERDLVKFYQTVNRKDPATKAVVAFSNAGVDESRFIFLVYVEIYVPQTGLRKFYYRIDNVNSKYDKIPIE